MGTYELTERCDRNMLTCGPVKVMSALLFLCHSRSTYYNVAMPGVFGLRVI